MITLKFNGLNDPICRKKVNDWIGKKKRPSICHLQETYLRAKDKHRLKVKGWEKISHANKNDIKAEVAISQQTKQTLKQSL